MASIAGNTVMVVRLLQQAQQSSNILTPPAYDTASRAAGVSTAPTSTGALGRVEPIVVTGALAGVAGAAGSLPGYGDYWFERIHVLPSTKAYAFILSSQHVFVEVYNAFRTLPQTVTTITELGPAGVTIVTPHVLPMVFGPLQSKIFDIMVSASGAPRAANTIQFDFDGVPEPVLTITGLRLLPFTLSPDWDAGMTEDVIFATDVMISADETEQRMQLRVLPNRAISYKVSALDTRENGLLASLLWSWQSRSYGVLLWMNAAPLLADVAAGALTVGVDTTHMGLTIGDTVIIIRDAFTWFASSVNAFDAVSVSLDTPLDQDFLARITAVIPVVLGRVAPELALARPTNATSTITIKFDLQVVAA